MLWEARPLDEVSKRLGERGIACVIFEPCGNLPSEGNYVEVMRRNLDQLRRAANLPQE